MTTSNSMAGSQYQMAMNNAYQQGGMSVLMRILNQMNTKEKQSMLQNLMLEQGQQNQEGGLKTGQGRVAGPKQVDRMAWIKAMGSSGGGGGGMGGMGGMGGGMGMMGGMGGMMGGMGGG